MGFSNGHGPGGPKSSFHTLGATRKGWLEKGVSKNSGTPKSSILIGFSIMNHFGVPLFLETPI